MSRRRGPVDSPQRRWHGELSRRVGARPLKRRILVVCEDQQSAKHYFEALKKQFQLSAVSVRVEGSKGRSSPNQVVERARKLLTAASDQGEPFDEVWCVIDGDYGNLITPARSLAELHGIDLAISTPCFEYWLLLHYEESNREARNCDQIVRRLQKHERNYSKGEFDFTTVIKSAHLAADRARRLRKRGVANDFSLPEQQNPCSEVYLLLESLGVEDGPSPPTLP